MISKKWLGILLALMFTLSIGIVFSYTNGATKWHGKTHKSCFMNELTEEQKEAFFQAMMELKESDLSYEEMKEEKLRIMEELGINMDETSCGMWKKTGWNHDFKGKHGSHCS